MTDSYCVGLLSTVDQPLLPFYLAAILSQKIENIVVICDSKKISEKDKKMLPTDGTPQDPHSAKYWNPIPDEKFKIALKKVSDQKYKYQRL